MPTIEIVSLQCTAIPDLPVFSTFAYIAETELHSHRHLFQPEFDKATGVIVHLGNKVLEEDLAKGEVGICWFASDLIDWQGQEGVFRFLPTVIPEITQLLTLLLTHSPIKEIYFSTDYQFGLSRRTKRENCTIAALMEEHNLFGLRWNCLYHIVRGGKTA